MQLTKLVGYIEQANQTVRCPQVRMSEGILQFDSLRPLVRNEDTPSGKVRNQDTPSGKK